MYPDPRILFLAALSFLGAPRNSYINKVQSFNDSVKNIKSGWPNPREFLDKTAAQNACIKICEIVVNKVSDISETQHGYYDPRSNTVIINWFVMPKEAYAMSFANHRNNKILRYDEMAREVNLKNSAVPIVLIHEMKHFRDRNSYSRIGMTASQIAQINIIEEITARIEELLFRRDVFLQTNSIDAARTGIFGNGKSQIFLGNYDDEMGGYDDWLEKNIIAGGISATEINALINCAIKMTKNHLSQYKKSIPAVIRYDFFDVRNRIVKHMQGKNIITEFVGFEGAKRRTLAFNGIEFLNECDDDTKAKLNRFVSDFANGKEISKMIDEWKMIDELLLQSDLHAHNLHTSAER
ncbi:MAG: hypothetical protein LBJ18_00090 [Rickettsiales bacterium]|nr:hypothetical protein [Rickettsiales bacterium]